MKNQPNSMTDHLGNVRAVVGYNATGNNPILVRQKADYYPFGWKHQDSQVTSGEKYRYGYQGEFAEEESDVDNPTVQQWNQFELRMWDGRIGRWMTTDPKFQYHSPYLGMGNNPVQRVDPDGGDDNDYGMKPNGEIVLLKITDDDFDRLFEIDYELNKINEGYFQKFYDQELLMSFECGAEWYRSTKIRELRNLWKFGVQHSTAEWSLAKGLDIYAIGSYYKRGSAPSGVHMGIPNVELKWHIHNHPGEYYKTGEKEGQWRRDEVPSGYNPDGTPEIWRESDIYKGGSGDYLNAYNQWKAMKEKLGRDPYEHELPINYLLDEATGKITIYNVWNGKIKTIHRFPNINFLR